MSVSSILTVFSSYVHSQLLLFLGASEAHDSDYRIESSSSPARLLMCHFLIEALPTIAQLQVWCESKWSFGDRMQVLCFSGFLVINGHKTSVFCGGLEV